MGGLEAVVTGIMDEFKLFFKRWRFSREVFTGAVVVSAFLLAIPNVTNVSSTTFCIVFIMFQRPMHRKHIPKSISFQTVTIKTFKTLLQKAT